MVVVAVGAGFVTAHSHATAEQKKLAAARAELSQVIAVRPESPASTPVQTRPIVPVPAVTEQLQPRVTALATALEARVAWDRLLREFSLVMPSDVTVSGLTLASDSGFALTGLAYSQDSVARLLSRLSVIPDLEDVSLKSSSADPTSGQVTFTIAASVKTPTAVAVAVTGA